MVGFKGALNDKWDWSADGVIDYTDSDTHVTYRASGNSGVTGLLTLNIPDNPNIPGSPAPAAVRRAIYPLLADHEVYPITADTADAYFGGGRRTPTKSLQKEANVRLTGDVYSLPAGPVRTSLVGKFRHFERDSGFYTLFTPDFYLLANGSPSATGPVAQSPINSRRETLQGAVELVVPIFGKSWQPVPFIQGLDLNLSYSSEKNSTEGVNQSNQQPFEFQGEAAETYVAALKLQIVPDIALRGSFTEGFYPPDWNDLSDTLSPQNISNFFMLIFGWVDPLRGNRPLVLDYPAGVTNYNGGNPGTLPESAQSSNIGMILKPRFAPGLTMTLDYWRTKKTGAIVRTNLIQVLDRISDYEGSIVRAAPTATDTANGWAGLITEFYTGPINISVLETDGADINIRYDYDAGESGNFLFNTNASFTNHFQTQALPSSSLVETAGAGGPNRWRGYASAGWQRAGLGVTLTGRYVGKYSTNTTTPTSAFPSASGFDGPYIPAFTIYDLQFQYAIQSVRGGMLQGVLDGSQWTLGINNVFDTTPTMVSDGQGFYNRQVDPRQRFAYLQYRKSF